MIRQALSQAITEIANEVLPLAVGDMWRSENFTVIFQRLEFTSPTPCDGDWDGVAVLEGDIYVQILTDAPTPIDPTSLVVAIRENPIFLPPLESTPTGSYSVQLFWKPERVRDMLYTDRVITQMEGKLQNCYVLRKLESFPQITEVESNL